MEQVHGDVLPIGASELNNRSSIAYSFSAAGSFLRLFFYFYNGCDSKNYL